MSYRQHLRTSRHGILQFRYVFPIDVRQYVDHSEVCASLGTRCKREAELTRLALCLHFKQFVAEARLRISNHIPVEHLSTKAILALVRKLKEDNLRKAIVESDAETAQERALRIDLEGRLARSEREKTALAMQMAQGLAAARPVITAVPASGPTLNEAIAAFHAERVAVGKWTEKTAESAASKLRLLTDWFGNIEVSSLSRDAMSGFFVAIRRLPRNASKIAALKGLSMRQVVAQQGVEFISDKTVKLHMQTICALFEWLNADQARWGLRGNIAKGLNIARPEVIKRLPFDNADLAAIFSSVEWTERKFLHSYCYWLPVLGLYTGARINELCQLRLSDFRQIEGQHFIALCEDGTRSKTQASIRTIPVHSELVRLGLLRHVEKLRKAGESSLFPECVGKRDGHGQDASKWFGKFKLRCGIKDERKVFHSFRHTVQTSLLNKGVDEKSLVAPLVGHAGTGQGSRTYWNKKDVVRLIPVIELLQYPMVTGTTPCVEDVSFGTDVHRALRRPPSRATQVRQNGRPAVVSTRRRVVSGTSGRKSQS